MNDKSKENKLKEIIEKSHNIALFGHTSPDGDAIGAILGFGNILKKLNKNVSYFTPTKPTSTFEFIDETKKIQSKFDYGDYDTLIFLDFTTPQRIGDFFNGHEDYFKNKTIIQIDHHQETEEKRINLAIKDNESISTCELVFEYTNKLWPELFDTNIATYLYMGITTDSGNFQYEKNSTRTLSNAIKLIELGANKTIILDKIYNNQPLKNIILLQRILQRITLKNNFLYSYYLQKDLEELDVESGSCTTALSIMRTVKEAELILLIKDKDGIIKGSLRSKGKYDCTKIANIFGGGGHYNAAGFSVNIDKNFEETKIDIITKIQKVIK